MLGVFAPGTGGERGSASGQHPDPPATVQAPNLSAHLQHTWVHFFVPPVSGIYVTGAGQRQVARSWSLWVLL